MKNLKSLLIIGALLISIPPSVDEASGFLHEKPGEWSLKYTIQAKTPEEVQPEGWAKAKPCPSLKPTA